MRKYLLILLVLLLSSCIFTKPEPVQQVKTKKEDKVWTIPGNAHPSKYTMWEIEGVTYYVLRTYSTPVVVCPETDKAIQGTYELISY